jgi:hypothetical protein
VYIWHFFISQGKSGSKKLNFLTEMPTIYKAIMTVAAQASELDKQTIITAIGEVVRSCQTRAESKQFKRDHPELFAENTQQILDDFVIIRNNPDDSTSADDSGDSDK